jgi:hypothetical protein
MFTIQEMQDNIISLLGYEHPDTVYFFNLCDHNEISKPHYIKFLNHMFNTFITLNSSKLKHIYYNVHNLQHDTITDVKCIEINKAIDYVSLFRIIPTGKFEYITIIDIITE